MRQLCILIAIILSLALYSCKDIKGNNILESVSETILETTKNENEIQLTLDNYKKYLNITEVTIKNYGDKVDIFKYNPSISKFNAYKNVQFTFRVEGASQAFIYNDVKITFKFSGTCTSYESVIKDASNISFMDPFEFNVTAELNVGGKGEGSYIFTPESPDLQWVYTSKDDFNVSADAVEVSGSVIPIYAPN